MGIVRLRMEKGGRERDERLGLNMTVPEENSSLSSESSGAVPKSLGRRWRRGGREEESSSSSDSRPTTLDGFSSSSDEEELWMTTVEYI